ncbi:hypothetical protein K443DRAFT_12816 [Laccaria amethystina LaAM-08-1]|uniref:Unplaced genomic scaffold K443scaffold_305, whole genome shotgun sequence n=1 Tax=Laccaria amethystina LaAM-08-1 TaxID=1095629 RepID=A0A0C9WQP1_9AGAR|nr:hypothetical protein K443DRAFT_12816 [Laccaria amethystina LaAM-08-1]
MSLNHLPGVMISQTRSSFLLKDGVASEQFAVLTLVCLMERMYTGRNEIPAYSTFAHSFSTKPTVNNSRPSHSLKFYLCITDVPTPTAPPPPNMFFALLAVLLTDVDQECFSDNTDAQLLRFNVWWRMNRDGNGRWMDRATTPCDVELVPFELALYRQHPSEIFKEWRAQGTNERSLDKSNEEVVPRFRNFLAPYELRVFCPTHCRRAAVSRTPIISINCPTARTPSSRYSSSRSACTLRFLIALVWLYTVIRPIARPTATPPYDIFTIYLLFLGSSILQIGRLLYDHTVFSTPYLPPFIILALSLNLVAVIGLLYLILSMPLSSQQPH